MKSKEKNEETIGKSDLLPLDPTLSRETLLENLKINALSAHQKSVGRGDELVSILRNTIEQVEKTHNRVQNMSTILFVTGLLMIAAGIYGVVFGSQGQEIWSALLGGTGGVAAVVATFYTSPIEKISASIINLVKLETAFLGYIRVIGELDSAFQLRYLDILSGENENFELVVTQTTDQVKDIMKETIRLIDRYVTVPEANSGKSSEKA
ncbi:MAG TPA: hypothetical protein VLA32_03945 [Anaerolineales bacterium]|jgi:hypothetical protein|nr:hypothetical protein [Anaerolineales bacterium]